MAHAEATHTVQVDIYIARRKRLHSVYDETGQPVYSDPHLMNILDWLALNDVRVAMFTDDEAAYAVSFTPVVVQPSGKGTPNHG